MVSVSLRPKVPTGQPNRRPSHWKQRLVSTPSDWSCDPPVPRVEMTCGRCDGTWEPNPDIVGQGANRRCIECRNPELSLLRVRASRPLTRGASRCPEFGVTVGGEDDPAEPALRRRTREIAHEYGYAARCLNCHEVKPLRMFVAETIANRESGGRATGRCVECVDDRPERERAPQVRSERERAPQVCFCHGLPVRRTPTGLVHA